MRHTFPREHLVNPATGKTDFILQEFNGLAPFEGIQRKEHYSLIWIRKGNARLKTGYSDYHVPANTLLSFGTFEPYQIDSDEPLEGVAIYFHSSFFCIYRHHKEISCNGVLYNNIYDPPLTAINEETTLLFQLLCDQMKKEMEEPRTGREDSLIACLKLLLVQAVRAREHQPEIKKTSESAREPLLLQRLKSSIEENFRRIHSPSGYADLLHITPKALTKLTRSFFNKPVSSLINERIITEAKRELFLTDKPVKQIASELGYEDEYYFSRFFKINTEMSPKMFRQKS